MPNFYVLKNKVGDSKKGNAQFFAIDEALCEHFKAPVHPEKWFRDWENCVGVALATGKSWDYLRDTFKGDPEIVQVIDFLDEHYDVDCGYTRT